MLVACACWSISPRGAILLAVFDLRGGGVMPVWHTIPDLRDRGVMLVRIIVSFEVH